MERTALEILEDCDPPEMTRTKLAKAVSRKLEPDLEENETEKFQQQVRTLARQFGRLKDGELFECAAERNTTINREILSFVKPTRGRRVGGPKL